MIDNQEYEVYYNANESDLELIVLKEHEYGLKNGATGEVDLLVMYPKKLVYDTYEFKTTNTEKAYNKYKKQQQRTIKWMKEQYPEYSCRKKFYVYNREQPKKNINYKFYKVRTTK